jgi:photosynthetic reaction center cytochrome c subunit
MGLDFSMRSGLAIFGALALAIAAIFTYPGRLIAQSSAPAPQSSDSKPKTAGETFKNIQVLNAIRQDELFPSMRYITAALGVRCDFCHAPDHFEKDDKPEKARAREMMKMMFAINNDNFKGRRQVTCYTCHRGNEHPVGTPAIPDAPAMAAQMALPHPPMNPPSDHPTSGEPGEKHDPDSGNPGAAQPPASALPSVDDILAKYEQALGGANAIQKAATRVEKGSVDIPEHDAHNKMEVYRKSPDKALAILHSPVGDVVEGYNGTIAWENRAGHGVTEETGDSLNRVKEWASFITALDLKQAYSRSIVSGIEKIAGHDAYRVFAFRNGGEMERLYFDIQRGFLVRVDTRIDSPLGSLPQETTYEDYRAVGGVNVPYTIRVAQIDSTTIYKWQSIEANVPVADDRFERPAAAPPEIAKPPKP